MITALQAIAAREVKPTLPVVVTVGTVRGGFKGHHYDDVRRAFDARQAAALGMRIAA